MKSKYFVVILLLLFVTGCTSFYTRGGVARRYNKLNSRLDSLMEDEIDEEKRADLENDFREFSNGMIKYKNENPDENTAYLNEYIRKASIKLENLRDLKD